MVPLCVRVGVASTETTRFIFAGNLRVAQIKGGVTHFFHKNHLGSSTVMSNDTGTTLETTEYLPYGGQRSHTGTDTSNYKFTDQELDPESGFYNYNARLYDPIIGKFVTADTIVPDPSNPQILNRYSYCYNNPLIYVDPSGHFGFIIGAIIGAVISGIQSDWDPGAMIAGAVIGGISSNVFSGVETAAYDAIYCSGMSDIALGAISGSAGGLAAGATAGGLGAAYYGGDIGESILKGAGYGALGGAAFGGIGGHFGDMWNPWRVGAHTIAGGGVAELSGSDFAEGAFLALATSASRFIYNELINCDATWEKGGEAVEKGYDTPPEPSANNIGTQGDTLNPKGWVNEGGRISRFANHIPGVNAVAGIHDIFQISLGQYGGNFTRIFFNVPGMLPAAGVTYAGLMADTRTAVFYAANPHRHRK